MLLKGYRNKWILFIIISAFLAGYLVGYSFGISEGIKQSLETFLFFYDIHVDNRALQIVAKYPVLKKIMSPEDWQKVGINNTYQLETYQYEQLDSFINKSLKLKGYA